MKITPDQALHIARLARLSLPPEAVGTMAEQLGSILTYVQKLSELDTSATPPTAHVQAVTNAWRDDVTTPLEVDRELMLSQAPRLEHNLFVVPKVIE